MQNERNKLSRQQKIKLLKDLAAGKISLSEAFPGDIELWFYDDGKFVNSHNGQSMTEEELHNSKSKRRRLIFKPTPGCEPIKDDTHGQ